MQVAIGIATCRQPVGLQRLLRGLVLVRQPYGVDVVVVVVDQDEAGSAAAAVAAVAPELPWPVRYLLEPGAGLPAARNRALEEAADCRFVAFLDDDEVPESDWLAELLLTQSRTGAVAVAGPVLPVFADVVPPWLAGAFALCYVRPTAGRPLREFSAANVLLDRARLAELDLTFDESPAVAGSEDALLARDLIRRGCRLAWAERALTYAYIPRSRATLGWLLRHWYGVGNTEILLARHRADGSLDRLGGLVRGGLRVVLGGFDLLLALPACLIGYRARALRRSYTIARGLGMLAGVRGRHAAGHQTIQGT